MPVTRSYSKDGETKTWNWDCLECLEIGPPMVDENDAIDSLVDHWKTSCSRAPASTTGSDQP